MRTIYAIGLGLNVQGNLKKGVKMKSLDVKQTFIVKITDCQNGTWQGKIVWAEANRTIHFRSMMEMLRLMDEAATAGIHHQEAVNE